MSDKDIALDWYIEMTKRIELEKEVEKWKAVAGKLYDAWLYARTYGAYPVADNAIKEYEALNSKQ